MTKILYFDYWTKGLPHNILPLDQHLSAKGIERIMVHVGSWRDPSVKDEEVIDGLVCRDIRFYGGDLRRAFETERPDATYVLNVGGAVDRLVNRICRNLNIKTVFLMHGVMPLGKNIDVEKKRLNKGFSIAKRLSKAPKYLRIYGLYLGEVVRTNFFELFNPRTYGHMLQMIISPGSVYSDPWIDKDLYPDLTLLYSEAFRKLFEGKMKFNPKSIKVVGFPQLDPVFQLAHSPESKEKISNLYRYNRIPVDKPIVVFIVDGLDSGNSSFTEDEWLEELRVVSTVVHSLGWSIILKLHPTNERDKVEDIINGILDVYILQLETDLSIVLGAIAVIGHISSALIVPIALNIPVIIPHWSNVYANFDYYDSNGAAISVKSIQELKECLQNISNGNHVESSKRTKFVHDFIGSLDGNSWRRVANELMSIIS